MIPFSWSNPYAWPRKPLLSQNVVATSQPFAAGGNAVDAILATAITVSLVEPVPNGIGSDAYALVFYGWGARGGFPMKEFSAYTAWQEHDEAPDGSDKCRERTGRFTVIVPYRILRPLRGG